MRREARLLLGSSVDSLVLSIDHFNRCDDRGRQNATLILLVHSFEMLLKAALVERGSPIRDKGANHTVSFKTCVSRALSDGTFKFIDENQAVLLRATYGLRSGAQHHVVVVSEPQLYLHVQGGLTLFRDVYKLVFGKDLAKVLPQRVLPVSTMAPLDIEALFMSQVTEVLKLLAPGRRSRATALARLEPLAVLSGANDGLDEPPTAIELLALAKRLRDGEGWQLVFPGAASLGVSTEDASHRIQLRLVRNAPVGAGDLIAIPVPEGTANAELLALKRVNDWDYYGMNHTQLANAVGITSSKLTAYISLLRLKTDIECSKEFPTGKTRLRKYAPQAITRIREAMESESPEDAWRRYRRASQKVATG